MASRRTSRPRVLCYTHRQAIHSPRLRRGNRSRAQVVVGSLPAGGGLATLTCATPTLPVLERPVVVELPELEETYAELRLEKTYAELEETYAER